MYSDRQQQILHASLLLIDKYGIQGFTIKNLAKEIGISEPAIYRHFESKVDILDAILDTFKFNILSHHQKDENEKFGAGEIRLKLFFELVFAIFTENPTLVSVIFAEEIFQNEPRLSNKIAQIQEKNEQSIIAIIDQFPLGEKMSTTPKDILALMLLGSVRLLVRKWKLSSYSFNLKEKGAELIDEILKVFKT